MKKNIGIVRKLFYPVALIATDKNDRTTTVDQIFSTKALDPSRRYYAIATITYLMGAGIPLTTWIMGMTASAIGDLGIALQIVTAPLIFFVSVFAALAIRLSEASFELKNWRKLRKQGRLDEYEPGHHAQQATPRDADVLIPLILTIIGTPIVLPFMGLAT